jgi:hypothetical protein
MKYEVFKRTAFAIDVKSFYVYFSVRKNIGNELINCYVDSELIAVFSFDEVNAIVEEEFWRLVLPEHLIYTYFNTVKAFIALLAHEAISICDDETTQVKLLKLHKALKLDTNKGKCLFIEALRMGNLELKDLMQ